MAFDVEQIEKAVDRVRKFIKKDSKRPSVKAIHNLRTSARRLESDLNALALNKSAKQKRLLSDLAEARKAAGKVRDMDVFSRHALALNRKEGEENCLVQLTEHLGAERDKAVRKLRETLHGFGARLSRELKRTFRNVEKGIAKPGKNGVNTGAQAAVAAKAMQLSSELGEPPRLSRANLHPYRLKVKEVRYILQLSDRADDRPFVGKLGEVKDAIGEWHDFVELIDIAGAVLDHGSSCKLLQQLRSTSNARFERAISLSNQLRRQYLRRPQRRRRGNRGTGATQLSPSALMAVSSIAQV